MDKQQHFGLTASWSVEWIPVPGRELPHSQTMVLLWTPCYDGGPVTYGWLRMDGRWYMNSAIGPTEILLWKGKGEYESAVKAWMAIPHPPTPQED